MSFSPIGAVPPLIPGDANFESVFTSSLVAFQTVEVNEIITNIVTGLLPPVNGTDATNKDYVDELANNLVWKNPVRLSTTTEDLTLSGSGQFIDGVMTLVGDRILVKNQTNSQENGIYVVATGSWIRPTGATIGIPATGVYVYVVSGTVNQTKLFVCQTPSSEFGDNITFTLFSSGGSGTPGGPSNGSVQFNNAGSFDGSNNFQWSSGILTVTGSINSTQLSSSQLLTTNLTSGSLLITGNSYLNGNSFLNGTTITNATIGDLTITGVVSLQNILTNAITTTGLNVSGPSVLTDSTMTGTLKVTLITTSQLNVSDIGTLTNLVSSSITTSGMNVTNGNSIRLGSSSSILLDGTSSRITGLPLPLIDSEAANKAYVDAQIGSSPGGTEGSIQYNSGGLFTGDANFKWSGTTFTVLGATNTTGQFVSTNTIDSVSPTTGSMVLTGGMGITGNVHVAASVYANGFFTTSDVMCKTDIKPLYNSTDIINKIECCSYKLIGGDNKTNYGVLAQQLDNIGLDNLVNKTDKYKSVNYTQLIALIINSLQELHSEIDFIKKISMISE
jgi:hypothetical protein